MNQEKAQSVAIIVPCYKVGKYLSDCLESILRQSYQNIRVYAIDDCSPDDTRKIIDEYAARDARVTGVTLERNSGVSAARNRGIDLCQEDWCMFVDGDDALPPDAVASLLELQSQSGAGFVIAGSHLISEDGRPLPAPRRRHGRRRFAMIGELSDFFELQPAFCSSCCRLFPVRELNEKGIRFRLGLSYGEDTLFVHEYLLKCRPECCVDFDRNVYLYRQRESSCVHSIMLKKRLAALEIVVAALDDLAVGMGISRRLAALKAAEYLWAIRKFSDTQAERRRNAQALVSGRLFAEHIYPVLSQFGKFRHRTLVKMLARGWAGCIRFW